MSEKSSSTPAEHESRRMARESLDVVKPFILKRSSIPRDVEVSAHQTPRALREDIGKVFFQALENAAFAVEDIKIIPTVQKTKMSILAINEETAREKDECLEDFTDLAEQFCSFVVEKGSWADYCDPCSGLPMKSNGNVVYSEIQGLEKVRRFPTTNAGACRVAMHPVWGPNMYPATIFTSASPELIVLAFQHCQDHE